MKRSEYSYGSYKTATMEKMLFSQCKSALENNEVQMFWCRCLIFGVEYPKELLQFDNFERFVLDNYSDDCHITRTDLMLEIVEQVNSGVFKKWFDGINKNNKIKTEEDMLDKLIKELEEAKSNKLRVIGLLQSSKDYVAEIENLNTTIDEKTQKESELIKTIERKDKVIRDSERQKNEMASLIAKYEEERNNVMAFLKAK